MMAEIAKNVEAMLLGVLAAGLAWGVTYAVKHHVPDLWLAWLASGGVISWLLSRWRSRQWLVIGLATPSLVLAETLWRMTDAPPTAAALGLGFWLFWAGLSLAGAAIGRAGSH